MASSFSQSTCQLPTAIMDFGLALLHQIRQDDMVGNMFFSPLSVASTLAMTSLGARHTTASQMLAALHLAHLKDSDIHCTFAKIKTLLNTSDTDSYMLKISNRLFARKDHTFLEDYLSSSRKHYETETQLLDFASNPEGSRLTINKWVEEQTAGKICDLLSSGSINSLTALVLTNAIYFKGDWQEQFDRSHTRRAPFHMTLDDTIEVDMMYKHDTFRIGFSEELDCRSVELPYKGGDLSMVCIIPNKPCGLKDVEGHINATNIQGLIDCPDQMKIMLWLPRFKLEFESPLKSKLQSMGMIDAFEYGKADFSGMDGTQQLFISEVAHKAYIEVNEEGTEAAAATGVQMMLMSMPLEFNANQPFLFMIKDQRSGTVLFMGRVAKPTTG